MLDTVILLTGPVDETVLAAVLQRHNPNLSIRSVKTLAELEAVGAETLARARLIAFVTPVIVPARLLSQLGHGAYNFHPGPPHYPGWVPSHLAVYERATQYGATAHAMVARVDAGPIVDVGLFEVPPGTSVLDLERMAFKALARLFWQQAGPLATQAEPLTELPVAWSGRKSTRRMYEAMCEIPPDISKDDLDRRIAAFSGAQDGPVPAVTLHGHRFRLVAEPNAGVEAPALVPGDAHSLAAV
ncbi:MAG: formyltransferase family protein [Pseudolabrys sp.]|nr:formyltransferase family protein [Pseudolabrys sp.]